MHFCAQELIVLLYFLDNIPLTLHNVRIFVDKVIWR